MSDLLIVINRQFFSANGQALAGLQIAVLVGDINGASQVNATAFPGSPLATLYADPAAAQPVSNPVTTDGLGNLCSTYNGVTNLGVWVATSSNKYFVLQVSGPGISGQQLIPLSVPSSNNPGS